MWNAFRRDTLDAAEASIIAATSSTQGVVNGVRHAGARRDTRTAAAHAVNAAATAASSDVIDWRGSRTRGRASSNGAASVSNATPTNMVSPAMSFAARMTGQIPRSLPRRGEARTQGTPAAYVDCAPFATPQRGGTAYGGRKIVSKRETTEPIADRLQSAGGSGRQRRAVRDHDCGGAAPLARRLRHLLARVDAWLDACGRDRFRHATATRARGVAPAGGGGGAPPIVAARAARDDRRGADCCRRRAGAVHRYGVGGADRGARARVCVQRAGRVPSLFLPRPVAHRCRVVADTV